MPHRGGLIMEVTAPTPGRRLVSEEPRVPASPYAISLDDAARAALEAVSRRAAAPFRLVKRARIALLAADGLGNSVIASRLGICEDTARK